MSAHIDKLRKHYQDTEAKAQKLQADKDAALEKIRDRFTDRLRQANQDTADAQKQLLDAEAAAALLDRPDGAQIAENLGLILHLDQD